MRDKKVFMFPGQGSQEIGMGHDLKDDAFFCSLIELGSDIVHEDLQRLCLRGPERQLMQARFLQPALVAVCLGYLNRLSEYGISPDLVLGHSLGEIASLAASGVVDPGVAVTIAAKRGELMDKVASQVEGGMMAVMFMQIETIEKYIEEMNEPGRIVLANDNAPGQVVISGDNKLLDKFAERVNEEKAGKCKRVNVIGPWHSPFLNEVRYEFEQWAEEIKFQIPLVPMVMNATAKPETHPTTIKHLVTWQLTSPVFWRESMDYICSEGVSAIFEVGPGRVLSGLSRVNGFSKETTVYNINNLRGVELAASEFTETVAG